MKIAILIIAPVVLVAVMFIMAWGQQFKTPNTHAKKKDEK